MDPLTRLDHISAVFPLEYPGTLKSHMCQIMGLMVNLNGQLDWILINFKTHLWVGLWGISRKEYLRGSPIPAEWVVPCSWGPDVWISKERQCCLPSVSDSGWWDQTSVLLLVRLSFWGKDLASLSFRYGLIPISDCPGILRPSGSDSDLGSSLAGQVTTSAACRQTPLNYTTPVIEAVLVNTLCNIYSCKYWLYKIITEYTTELL